MYRDVYKEILEFTGDIYIWGAGSMAKEVYHRLQEHEIVIKGFVVNVKDKSSDEITDLPIVHMNEIDKNDTEILIVCGHGHYEKISDMYAYKSVQKVCVIPNPYKQYQGPGELWICEHKDEIRNKLDRMDRISRECVNAYYNVQNTCDVSCILNPELYIGDIFEFDKLPIGSDEIYVDIGAYTGDTVDLFEKSCQSRFSKIIAIEPNKKAFERLQNNIKHDKRIIALNCALGTSNGKIKIDTTSMQSTFVSDMGNVETEVYRYDDLIPDENVTIMKIFVPFMALPILEGAKKSILKYKPQLIVNVGADDGTHILDVIDWIEGLHAGYTISMRYDFPMPTRLSLFATKKKEKNYGA